MKNFYTKYFFWLLGFAAVLAASVSLYIGLQQSVWFDEAYSIALAKHSWGDIVRLTAQDVHPPVYYWLLKAWMTVFGSSELALRGMSALFLGLSIGVAGLLIKKLFGAKTALITLFFLVFAPFLLRYGFEIRMYAFVSFIGISATYLLILAVDETRKKKRWLLFFLYALLVALGVYTLYFMALLWITHLTWLMWLAYTRRQRTIVLPAVAAYGFAFILFVPWLPVLLSKAAGNTLSPVTHQLGLENLYGILTFLFLYRPSWDMVSIFGILIIACIVAMVGYISRRAIKNATAEERHNLVLLLMYFFVPVLVLVVLTHFLPIYIERYVAHIAIGLYGCIGVLVALALRSRDRLTYAVVGGLGLVLILGCVSLVQFGNYNFQRVHKPSIREVSGLLASCRDGAIIFADGPQAAIELGYYITDCPIYFFNETLEMGGGFAMLSNSPLRVANASELPDTKEILYVYYDDPKQIIPATFTRNTVKTIEAVSVADYKLEPK